MDGKLRDAAANAGKVAAVFEGGSFRCQFTAGVVDVLLENGIDADAATGCRRAPFPG